MARRKNKRNKGQGKKTYSIIVDGETEIWYFQMFEPTSRYYSKCEDAAKELKKKYLPDYEKSQKYYKKRNNTIYSCLKPYQKTEIENAQKLGDFDFQEPESAKAEIYKIFEILGIE